MKRDRGSSVLPTSFCFLVSSSLQVTLTAKLSLESNPGLVLLPLVYQSSKVTVPRRDYESSGAFVSVFIQKVWDMPRSLQV